LKLHVLNAPIFHTPRVILDCQEADFLKKTTKSRWYTPSFHNFPYYVHIISTWCPYFPPFCSIYVLHMVVSLEPLLGCQVASPHGIGQGPGRRGFAYRDALAPALLFGRLAAEGEGFHETWGYGWWRGFEAGFERELVDFKVKISMISP
jgi:hypothetical protein